MLELCLEQVIEMSYDENALKKELIRDEGKRLTPYRDSLGYWTVGVWHRENFKI